MTAVAAASVIEELLSRGHAVRFQARGDSMFPLIHDADYLHVEPASDRPRRGEVVLVLADRGLTAHRIVAVRAGTIITRGDNAPDCDPPVPESRILGRVVRIEHEGVQRPVSRFTLPLRLWSALRRQVGALRRVVSR